MKNLLKFLVLIPLVVTATAVGEQPYSFQLLEAAAPPQDTPPQTATPPTLGTPSLSPRLPASPPAASNETAPSLLEPRELNPILPAIEAEEPENSAASAASTPPVPIQADTLAPISPQPLLEAAPEDPEPLMVTAPPIPAENLRPFNPPLGASAQVAPIPAENLRPFGPQLGSSAQVPPLPALQGLPQPAQPSAQVPGQLPGQQPAQLPGQLPTAITPPETEIDGVEFAIILSSDRFHPSRVRMKAGRRTELLFTTVNPKPAALIIERLKVQTWIPSEGTQPGREPSWEVNRELGANRITRIPLNPEPGTYLFHDAITGATGEIVVE